MVAISMGVILLGFAIIATFVFYYLGTLLLLPPLSFCLICYYVSICCFIAARRCKREKELFNSGDFMIATGYIKELKAKHKWNTKVTVVLSNGEVKIYALICPDFKKNEKVYIALANKSKANWVLPRIVSRESI